MSSTISLAGTNVPLSNASALPQPNRNRINSYPPFNPIIGRSSSPQNRALLQIPSNINNKRNININQLQSMSLSPPLLSSQYSNNIVIERVNIDKITSSLAVIRYSLFLLIVIVVYNCYIQQQCQFDKKIIAQYAELNNKYEELQSQKQTSDLNIVKLEGNITILNTVIYEFEAKEKVWENQETEYRNSIHSWKVISGECNVTLGKEKKKITELEHQRDTNIEKVEITRATLEKCIARMDGQQNCESQEPKWGNRINGIMSFFSKTQSADKQQHGMTSDID